MKKIRLAVAVCFASAAILLPVIGSFNNSNFTPDRPLLERADGNPPVPPVPPWTGGGFKAA